MASRGFRPVLAALAVALFALILALAAGAPLTAALLALLGGFFATLIGRQSPEPVHLVEATVTVTGLPPLPPASDLLEAVDEPLLIVRNRKVLLANEAAHTVLGDHILGTDVRLAIRHPTAAERLTQEPAPEPSRTELVGLGELDRRWEMVITPLKDGSRLVRLTDRSKLHATEQMRVDFVANASHELRTPLATLLGYLETLQDDATAGEVRTRTRFLKIMFDEARRMHQLVDDLISLSRIEAERFSVPRDPVELVSLVEEVRESCHQLIEEKQSRVVVTPPEHPPVVLGDRTQLLQLLRNLIVNALKYGRAGSDVVVAFAEAGDDMLRISVADQGEGIAPEHLPRLTQRFYRVDAGRSRAVGGTGLGLAIVKHIAQRHRGSLDIESKLGEGTTVSVLLPRGRALS